ncbi:MAG: methyltransferase domain-containing protein [Leptospiraceae bacterium]|nr:methyltransferase domain-containing protein [Leptospiraceae bacterium]
MENQVGDEINLPDRAWSFGGDVPRTFDQHVSRSVPLYQEGHGLILRLSDFFITPGSLVLDIGCSTGSLLKELAKRHPGADIRFMGIDREKAMIDECQRKHSDDPRIQFQHATINDAELESADFIISYYTMQFIRPRERQLAYDRIFQNLNWGGALVLFEKVRANDARFQDIITQLYTDFKQDMGYSSDEILAKSRSLKGVLEPFSSQANKDMLQRAGFKDYLTILKYLSFEGFLAIK